MQEKSENMRRMVAALAALRGYAYHQCQVTAPMRADPAEHVNGMITDLLTDLRHYCAVNGEDFEKHMRRSLEHFNAEIAE